MWAVVLWHQRSVRAFSYKSPLLAHWRLSQPSPNAGSFRAYVILNYPTILVRHFSSNVIPLLSRSLEMCWNDVTPVKMLCSHPGADGPARPRRCMQNPTSVYQTKFILQVKDEQALR